MTLLFLAGLAHGSEGIAPAEPPAQVGEAAVDTADKTKANKSGGKKSAEDDTTSFKKGKLWGWTYRPYVMPGGGLTIGNGGLAVTGAVDVGIRYRKDNWKGDLQAGGSYTTGSELNGWDVHAGNEFGRREKYWGLTAGLIGFYNQYLDADGNPALEASVGLDIPVEVVLGPRKYYAYGTITPSFLFNEDRHVPGLPFGDELEWGAGAGLKLKWITAEVGFTQRITTIGTINTPTISVSISGD